MTPLIDSPNYVVKQLIKCVFFFFSMSCSCNPPSVPYLGMYLTDLAFIEEGTPNFTEEGLVNFSKMRMVGTFAVDFFFNVLPFQVFV